ncbi:hypothetical protein [Ralstonia phage RP13]|nr:hypothetical protein [Ralstonia phage RP13]
MKDKVLAIDATWLIRRQFHACNMAIVPGTGIEAKEATETEPAVEAVPMVQDPLIVVVSFLQCVLKDIRETEYQYPVYALWDRGTYRYRPKDKFTGYKASREYDDRWDACWSATDIARDLLRTIGIGSIQVPGCEADDLGMYYSHNSNDCILRVIDSDWQQSIRPTTKILKKYGEFITYEDVVKEHITEPFDLAIDKAIRGGHDDLVQVQTGLDMAESIRQYKARTLPVGVLNAIDSNMQLSRLDRILTDKQVHEIIATQEAMTQYPTNKLGITIALGKVFKEFPPYFLGVLGKYINLHRK